MHRPPAQSRPNLRFHGREGVEHLSGNVREGQKCQLVVIAFDAIDILKIDRTFIRDLSINSDSSAIVTAITALAKSLNLTIVAEGVETKEQFDYLCIKRCDRAQGFLISKPLNTDALSCFLRPYGIVI